jgi:hypothetical protein
MLKSIVTWIILFLCYNLSGQIQDTFYVFSESGLWLRNNPSFDSEKIRLLPAGSLIDKVIDYSENYSNIGWITDRWVKVSIADTSGYLFKGYLSTFKYPKKYYENISINLSYLLETYLDSYYTRIGICDTVMLNSSDGEGFHVYLDQLYNDSIAVEHHAYWEGGCTIIKSKNRSINDGINLVKALLEKSKNSDVNFKDSIYYKDENSVIYRVEDGSRSYFLYEIKFDKKLGLTIKMCFPCC